MADEMYNVGVRKSLNDWGVTDERIGYDPNTGSVSIDGKNVFKPQANRGGSTFTDQSTLNSIRGNVNQLNNAYNVQQSVLNPQQTVNPYDQQFNDLLTQIRNQVTNPTAIDRNSIYQSPDYAAQQAQVQKQAGQAIRSGQEALGTSGMARSSDLARLAQNAQNDANTYLETQVVPQLIAAEQAKQQQQLGNLMSLIGVLGQQQGLYDTRGQNQFRNQFDVLDFMTNQGNRAEDVAYRNQTRAEDVAYRDKRDEIGDQRYDQETAYKKERDAVADQQLAEEKAYRAQRDSEEDRRWWTNYEREGQQFAAQQGLQWAQLNQRQKEFVADQAYKEKALAAQNDPDNIDNRYKEAQLKKMSLENEQNSTPAIDEYDLIAVEGMAKDSGLNINKAKPEEIKTFVAGLKSKYGWDTSEANAVNSYLLSKSGGLSQQPSESFLESLIPSVEGTRKSVQSNVDAVKGIPQGIQNYGQFWADYFKDVNLNPLKLFQ
ncbi:hypothetical protein [Paenibacillus contaminans]|uniref:Uncharacterized protein n=1 Tax=Paenibacillus contaminans TaxID=450362 RepID=A0A329MRN3_9BACL|nr:hypothetical protein [Paenibacillus contaminans]RAV22200.1 hypothetical protein DQG23_04410 [Paenibacillus contaminans]